MERLTMKIGKLIKCVYESTEECHDMESCYQCQRFWGIMRKLAAYEDAEEEDWLVVLPCKPGDSVYYRKGNVIESAMVTSIARRWDKDCWNIYLGVMEIPLDDFTKHFHLTREAAEAAFTANNDSTVG